MDGLMCEDIRIGILVRSELQKYEWTGPHGITCAFSSCLMADAGGLLKFLANWKRSKIDGQPEEAK